MPIRRGLKPSQSSRARSGSGGMRRGSTRSITAETRTFAEIFGDAIWFYNDLSAYALNGSNLSRFDDVLGASQHLTQSSPAGQPAFNATGGPGDGPFARFNGDAMAKGTGLSGQPSVGERVALFAVARTLSADSPSSTALGIAASGGGQATLQFVPSLNVISASQGFGSIGFPMSAADQAASWHHLITWHDGAVAHLTVDGDDVTGVGSGALGTVTAAFIGSLFGSATIGLDECFVCAVRGTLTQGQVNHAVARMSYLWPRS